VRVAGTRNDGIVVAAGLNGSERVVTTAGAFLREGEKVRPVAPSNDAAAKPASVPAATSSGAKS